MDKRVQIALVEGGGSGPEMMAQATLVAIKAAFLVSLAVVINMVIFSLMAQRRLLEAWERCSSAINPDTGQAMFESGAETAPTLAGQDKANPRGRILTTAMMLRHIGALEGTKSIEVAVNKILEEGYRTIDITSSTDDLRKTIGTKAMGEKILSNL